MKTCLKRMYFLCLVGLTAVTTVAKAQDVVNDWQTRTALEAELKLAKNLHLSIEPELRFENQFKLDRAQFESELEYKLFDFLSFGARYRYIINYRDKKDTEYMNRYMFSSTLKYKFDRWKPGLRISYTDYTDDNDGSSFLRYKAFVDYNIKACKLTPVLAIQGYHDLTNSDWYKVRYELGIEYKLFKKNSVGLSYKLDYYLNETRNRHIIDIGYKIRF